MGRVFSSNSPPGASAFWKWEAEFGGQRSMIARRFAPDPIARVAACRTLLLVVPVAVVVLFEFEPAIDAHAPIAQPLGTLRPIRSASPLSTWLVSLLRVVWFSFAFRQICAGTAVAFGHTGITTHTTARASRCHGPACAGAAGPVAAVSSRLRRHAWADTGGQPWIVEHSFVAAPWPAEGWPSRPVALARHPDRKRRAAVTHDRLWSPGAERRSRAACGINYQVIRARGTHERRSAHAGHLRWHGRLPGSTRSNDAHPKPREPRTARRDEGGHRAARLRPRDVRGNTKLRSCAAVRVAIS